MEFDTIVEQIKPLISETSLALAEIIHTVKSIPEEKVIKTLQWLADNDKIMIGKDGKYRWY